VWDGASAKDNRLTPDLGGGAWNATSPLDRKFYLGGYVQGYGLGMVDAGSLCISKYVPGTVSSMSPEQKIDYRESLELAHKAAPYSQKVFPALALNQRSLPSMPITGICLFALNRQYCLVLPHCQETPRRKRN
jgi:hypothetical protein